MRATLQLTPDQYEFSVKEFLEREAKCSRVRIEIEGKHKVTASGETDAYELDATADFDLLGVHFSVIVECKRYGRNVDRDEVLALHRKMQELGRHKAIMFATSGFQRGAVSYARKHGIALIALTPSGYSRITKSKNPPVFDLPQHAHGWIFHIDDGDVIQSLVESPAQLRAMFEVSPAEDEPESA